MPWFKVDDAFHSHPKTIVTSLSALGLWTVAGSWSGDHLTDGFVSDQAVSMLSRGASELADELVEAGLWKRTRGGYRFHDWQTYQPVKTDILDQRKEWREAKAEQRNKKQGKPRNRRSTSKLSSEDTSQDSTEDTRKTLKGVKPSRPVPSSSYEEESPTAQQLVGEWIERCQRRPPGNVIGQISKSVRSMLDEGVLPDDIRRGLAEWMRQDLHPSVLPSKVNSAMNATRNGHRTTDDNIRDFMSRSVTELPGGQSWSG